MKRTRTVRGATVAACAVGALLAGGTASANAATTTSSSASTLAKIRYCESGGDYQAQNASSTASGAYQFLDTTWRSLSASAGYAHAKDAPAAVQDAAARELFAAQGTSPWAASQSCWGSLGAVPTSSGTTSSGTSTASASSGTTSSRATSSGTTSSRATSSSTASGGATRTATTRVSSAAAKAPSRSKAPAKRVSTTTKRAPGAIDRHRPAGDRADAQPVHGGPAHGQPAARRAPVR